MKVRFKVIPVYDFYLKQGEFDVLSFNWEYKIAEYKILILGIVLFGFDFSIQIWRKYE